LTAQVSAASTTGGFIGKKPAASRRIKGAIFYGVCVGATAFSILALAVLLFTLGSEGLGRVSWDFINSYPSRFADQAGIRSALLGTLWLMALTALFAVPIGVGAAIYLEEFAPRNWFTKIIEVNINNLAGVPSIIYGLLGLTIFVRVMDLGRSVMAGALTMSLLILPIIIVASREGLRAVPSSLRLGALALGATPWQAVRFQVLGPAMPTILTGVILALSRAIGETAPLIMIGALTFVAFDPTGPGSPFTVLPIQIFNWTSRPQAGFAETAAAGIVVLMVVLLTMNAFAILLRNYFEGKKRW
jgi:phosphate transport system permease protein